MNTDVTNMKLRSLPLLLAVSAIAFAQDGGLLIQRTPSDGMLTIFGSQEGEDALLSCKLEKGNELVSDIAWLHKGTDDEEWSEVEGESSESLNPRSLMEDEGYQEREFQCQIGSETADFMVKVNGTLGGSGKKSHKHFRVIKFHKSYEIADGEDFVQECDLELRDDADVPASQIGYKWYKWTETNDYSFQPKVDEGKPNCSLSVQGATKWLEITGNEKADGDLEVHIQLLTPSTVKIEDARRDDRRGYKCIAYNISDESICSESVFFLRVKDKMAVLYPSVGIVAEVVVLLIIIFACEKAKGSSNSGSGSDNDDEYNGNAVRSGGVESNVRHRRA